MSISTTLLKKPTPRNEELNFLLETAIDAGSPEDQVEQFLSHGLVPLSWQWKFHSAAREADLPDGPVDIGLGGARGPGKSFTVLAQAGIDDCQAASRRSRPPQISISCQYEPRNPHTDEWHFRLCRSFKRAKPYRRGTTKIYQRYRKKRGQDAQYYQRYY